MSPSIKKGPQMIYRPAVGHQQAVCCIKKPVVAALVIILDGGTPSVSGQIIIDGNSITVNFDGGKP